MWGGNLVNCMLEKIQELIEEYYKMEKGDLIENYLDEFVFYGVNIEIRMSRRSLKHIVEQRKKDNYSKEKIYSIFEILAFIIKTNNYIITHNNKTKEYILTEEFTRDVKSIFIALEIIFLDTNRYYIKTGFYRLLTKLKTTYR